MADKTPFTLVEDIYAVLGSRKEGITPECLSGIVNSSGSLDSLLVSKLTRDEGQHTYRMSNHGWPDRKLWYYVNTPEEKEELRPEVKFKFLYGDLLEAIVLVLAEAAGHKVEGRQDEREINGLKGHIDCVIDGKLFDVKSANSRAFRKWSDNTYLKDDPFGYIDQLHLYLAASKDDPRVTDKSEAGWIVIDKELGHIIVRTLKFPDRDFVAEIDRKREMLGRGEPPKRCFGTEQAGYNQKLGVQCSYCPYKKSCYPGLRTFLYSNGPVYLTEVNKVPNVVEIG